MVLMKSTWSTECAEFASIVIELVIVLSPANAFHSALQIKSVIVK